MPCYDPPRDDIEIKTVYKTVYESGISPKQMEKVEKENDWFKGAICALMNELDRRDILPAVVAESSRNGLIGLMEFWDSHEKNDRSRLAKMIHGYSKDEQMVIRALLNDQSQG